LQATPTLLAHCKYVILLQHHRSSHDKKHHHNTIKNTIATPSQHIGIERQEIRFVKERERKTK